MSPKREPLIESKPPSPSSPPDDDGEEEVEALLNHDDDNNDNPLINYDFTEEEERVANILLQLPELIRNCPRVSLTGKSWIVKKKRSVLNDLSTQPCSANHDHKRNKAMKEFMKELYDLIERKNIFIQEVEKISIYQEKQRDYNLLLKETTEDNNPRASSNTSVEVDQNQVLHLGDEPSSHNRLEAHDQNQEREEVLAIVKLEQNQDLIFAGHEEVSASLKLEQNQVLQCGDEPSLANGLEAHDQNQALLCGGAEPNEELLCKDEALEEILKVDQDQERPSAAKPEADQIEGPSSPSWAKPDQNQNQDQGQVCGANDESGRASEPPHQPVADIL